MQTQTPTRLIRMLLIDSYRPGHAVELKLDGHIAINGKNGAGKTTLLRLIPLFFGLPQSRLTIGRKQNKSVSAYYLPHLTSYIVYEYERCGQLCMAIIHGQTGEAGALHYRFASSGYKPELFVDGEGNLIAGGKLKTHMDKQGVSATRELNSIEYQAIIQGLQDKGLGDLIRQYSYTAGRRNIRHMEQIINGVFCRVTSFKDLARIIVSTIRGDSPPPKLDLSKAEINSWSRHRKAYNAIMAEASTLAELEDLSNQLNSITGELTIAHSQAVLLHALKQEELADLLTARADCIVNYGELKADCQSKLEIANQRLSDSKSHLIAQQADYDRLHQHFKTYQTKKMDAVVAEVARLPQLEAQQQKLIYQLESLREKASKSGLLQALIGDQEEAAADHTEDQLRISRDRELLTKAELTQREQLQKRLATESQIRRSQLEDELRLVQDELEAAQEARADARRLPCEGDTQTTMAVASATTNLAELTRLQSAANAQKMEFKHKLELAERDLRDKQAQVEQLCLEAAKQKETVLRLTELTGESGQTLLHFIKSEAPAQAEVLLRLLPESILLRSDLAPGLTGGHDLLGVTFSFDAISAEMTMTKVEDWANQLVVEVTKQEAIGGKLLQAEAELHQAEEALNSVGQSYKEAASAVAICESKVSTGTNQLRSAELALKSSIREQKEANKQKLEKAESHCSQIQQQIKRLRDDLELVARNQALQIEAGLALIKKQRDEKEVMLDQQLQASVLRFQKAQAELNEAKEKIAQEEGFSPGLLTQLEQNKQEKTAEIAHLRTKLTEVQGYQLWLEQDWSREAELAVTITELRAKVAVDEQHYAQLSTQMQTLSDLHAETMGQFNSDEKKLEGELSLLDDILVKLADTGKDEKTLELAQISNTAKGLRELVNKLKQEWALVSENARTRLNRIAEVMRNIPGTEVADYADTTIYNRGLGAALTMDALIPIREWFNVHHKASFTSINSKARLLGLRLVNYTRAIEDFEHSVSSFSRELRSNLVSDQVFDNLSKIEVSIQVTQAEPATWLVLKQATNVFSGWYEASLNEQEVPDDVALALESAASRIRSEDGLSFNPEELLEVNVVVTDLHGDSKVAKSEEDLKDLSSNGLSFLILCMILIGFVNRIRKDDPVVVPFVIDELKNIDQSNIFRLLNLLARNNITLISAFPDVDANLQTQLSVNYVLGDNREIQTSAADAAILSESEEEFEMEFAHV